MCAAMGIMTGAGVSPVETSKGASGWQSLVHGELINCGGNAPEISNEQNANVHSPWMRPAVDWVSMTIKRAAHEDDDETVLSNEED